MKNIVKQINTLSILVVIFSVIHGAHLDTTVISGTVDRTKASMEDIPLEIISGLRTYLEEKDTRCFAETNKIHATSILPTQEERINIGLQTLMNTRQMDQDPCIKLIESYAVDSNLSFISRLEIVNRLDVFKQDCLNLCTQIKQYFEENPITDAHFHIGIGINVNPAHERRRITLGLEKLQELLQNWDMSTEEITFPCVDARGITIWPKNQVLEPPRCSIVFMGAESRHKRIRFDFNNTSSLFFQTHPANHFQIIVQSLNERDAAESLEEESGIVFPSLPREIAEKVFKKRGTGSVESAG